MAPIRAVLTDIEGTTSSIDFVKDVLFPYARQHLPAYVANHGQDPEVRQWLSQAAADGGLPATASDGEIAGMLQTWIDEDRKATPLKALQGLIWAQGYRDGAYRAHLYPEVPARLRQWKQAGLDLYVYSSGSVPAQQLFFGYSEAGDLSGLFSGYFDTEIGPKREVGSYLRIAEAIQRPPAEILFLSDVTAELDAAREAGMQTAWLVRDKVEGLPVSSHEAHRHFDSILV
ncbi:acireductone synthase [Frateuria aurantia]|uniref:Enolase-phosphatase E1 n=1 Tax=Frateuria aurantia (strain ATCC 33424 / DSM 6220 / KCTC 2777 / LMG 1558 / NBRC 3245 / NCIMB 13370) TaxID=767434 RepID=H8KYT1_FRAAD|nr:acireductone synthase [Frateuria aurantia]AFC86152.1 2,3-diketo-5-methylthio-1-phosphopentane phosphatase [Frateuria aurantia DSM 6220]